MVSHTDAFQKWQSKWLVGTLEMFIFFALHKKQRYGGELVELSRKVININIKVPTVYGILSRVKEWGLIYKSDSKIEDGVTRGTSRKYYHLSEKGEQYFMIIKEQIRQLYPVLQFDEAILMEEI